VRGGDKGWVDSRVIRLKKVLTEFIYNASSQASIGFLAIRFKSVHPNLPGVMTGVETVVSNVRHRKRRDSNGIEKV